MMLSPLAKVLIIMNNYFHDVATAMLLSSAVILWLLGREVERQGPDAVKWFASLYPVLTKVAGGIGILWFAFRGEWRAFAIAQKLCFCGAI